MYVHVHIHTCVHVLLLLHIVYCTLFIVVYCCLLLFIIDANCVLIIHVVNVDMTRVLTSVLLQETQPLDSKGEATIASTYSSW